MKVAFSWLMNRLLPILALTCSVIAVAAEEGRVGDLGYDPSLWRLDLVGDHYRLHARTGARADIDMTVTMSFEPASTCRPETLPHSAPSHHGRARKSTLSRPGLDIHVVQIDFGCRNRRPLSVFACAAYKGRVYRFAAPIGGCKGGSGENPMMAFLEGLRGL
jgi:hypothetical protein